MVRQSGNVYKPDSSEKLERGSIFTCLRFDLVRILNVSLISLLITSLRSIKNALLTIYNYGWMDGWKLFVNYCTFSRTGEKSNHPDDSNRLATRYVRRDSAIYERDRRHHYEARQIAYAVMDRLKFLRGWVCSRSVLRERWSTPYSAYRTAVSQVDDQSIWKTVREVLPGEDVSPDDKFLDEFVQFVKMSGFMSFDTERKKHPVMVQVNV